jgi:hypothetical protein
MTDTNYTRARQKERLARNKRAFDEIFGDPFASPEPVEGYYHTLKTRSSIMAPLLDTESRTTANPCRPSSLDFLCDVEHVTCIGLSPPGKKGVPVVPDPELLERFTETYIHESTTTAFSMEERSKLEQRLGQLFRAYRISPVARYFTTVRKAAHK